MDSIYLQNPKDKKSGLVYDGTFLRRVNKKSQSRENMTLGLGLKKLRYLYGIFKQEQLANAIKQWRTHQVRDREIGYAAISLVNVEMIAAVFGMTPFEVYKIITEKLDILDPSKNFDYELENYKLEVLGIQDDFRYDIEDGKREPLKLIFKSFTQEDITQIMQRQGKALMAFRIKHNHKSQWMYAYHLGYNPSWVQHREAAITPIKVEELMFMADAEGISHLELAEQLLSPVWVTNQEIARLRSLHR